MYVEIPTIFPEFNLYAKVLHQHSVFSVRSSTDGMSHKLGLELEELHYR